MPGKTLSLGEFALKLATFTEELPTAMGKATGEAALHVTSSVRDVTRADSGGDMRLSGVGRRGARVGARYDVKGTRNPVALVRATGPMHLLERGARPHEIRGRRGRLMRTPYGPRRSVQHPGAPAKHTWSRGVDASVPAVPRIYQAALRKQLQRFFS